MDRKVQMRGQVECQECGMLDYPGDYHPYAACLMFKACRDSGVVRANLRATLQSGAVQGFAAGWRTAATWAGRDDLVADIGSPAYLAELNDRLSPNAGVEGRAR